MNWGDGFITDRRGAALPAALLQLTVKLMKQAGTDPAAATHVSAWQALQSCA